MHPARTAHAASVSLFASFAACASAPAPVENTDPTPVETATPSTSASATAAPVDAPRPPAAEGRERVAFSVARSDQAIGLTLDIPATWSIEPNENTGPSFQSCTSAAEVPFGIRVHVGAQRCEDGEVGEKCVARIVGTRMGKEGEVIASEGTPTRRWIETRKAFDKGGGEQVQYQGELFIHDEAHRAVIHCGYIMSRDGEVVRSQHKEVCATLALDPTASAHKLTARDAKPDSKPGNAESIPHGEELLKVALGFHAAVTNGDSKAAEKYLAQAELCSLVDKSKLARCKQEVAKSLRSFAKELPKLTEHAKKAKAIGFFFMSTGNATNKEPFYVAYAITADQPCKSNWEVGWPMMWMNDKAVVLAGMEKAEPKGPKKATKKK